jgi:hypothetical protein
MDGGRGPAVASAAKASGSHESGGQEQAAADWAPRLAKRPNNDLPVFKVISAAGPLVSRCE